MTQYFDSTAQMWLWVEKFHLFPQILLTELPFPSSVPGQWKYLFSMVQDTLVNFVPSGDMYLDVVYHFPGVNGEDPMSIVFSA